MARGLPSFHAVMPLAVCGAILMSGVNLFLNPAPTKVPASQTARHPFHFCHAVCSVLGLFDLSWQLLFNLPTPLPLVEGVGRLNVFLGEK